jgi:hypothetical protein
MGLLKAGRRWAGMKKFLEQIIYRQDDLKETERSAAMRMIELIRRGLVITFGGRSSRRKEGVPTQLKNKFSNW